MERLELIRTILTMHNHFVKVYMSKLFRSDTMTDKLFNLELLEVKADRFYLVEHPATINQDYENKKFAPMVEVRYHLRSKEANAYGDKHQAFYDRYLSTVAFEYEAINDVEKWKRELQVEVDKLLKEREERNVEVHN